MAQKIAGQFDNLNATWTDTFMKTLDKYDAAVQKMQDRATIAAGKGKDITAATTAIQLAKTAITTARTAMTAQAAKTYTPDTSAVTSATAITTAIGQENIMKVLRASFQTLHAGLFKDLFALRDGPMKNARTAVQNALQSLGKVPGVNDDKSATTTEATLNQ
jgi:predicted phage tail protein